MKIRVISFEKIGEEGRGVFDIEDVEVDPTKKGGLKKLTATIKRLLEIDELDEIELTFPTEE